MPRHPSSRRDPASRAQSAATRDEKEARLQHALAEYNEGQHSSIAAAAAAHNVPRTTLSARLQGRTPKKQAQVAQQALSPSAEMALAEHIQRCASNQFPLNTRDVVDFAQMLAHGHDGSSGMDKIGHNWLTSFLLRHPELKACWSRCLENARVRSTDPAAIKAWFERLHDVICEFSISSDNIYNMDETGFMFGQGASQRVLVPGGDPASRFKAQPGTRESATVVECIGSGGQVLPPLIITRGKVHTVGEHRRMVDIPTNWNFSKGHRGYNDINLAKLWVQNIFDYNTRPSTPSAYRLLIIDGHKIHTSLPFLEALWQQRIVPFCLPPHCTHIMQPLDVSIFGPLTAAYRRMVTELAPHVAAAGIDKAQFGTFYAQAREQVLTPSAARKAFRDSGITVYPSPQKVLARLPGYDPARRQPGAPQLAAQTNTQASEQPLSLDDLLEEYRNEEDPRSARTLKHTLLQAYQSSQAEMEMVQAENSVLHAQEDRNKAVARKKVPRVAPGDRIYLSRERMITREHAERELVAKRPNIVKAQERDKCRKEKSRAVDNEEELDDDAEELLSPSGSVTPPQNIFWDLLDDDEPLSVIEDDEASMSVFYDEVPYASTSRCQL